MTLPSTPGIEPAEFRQLMGRFATGVTILTAHAPDGTLQGMTANSLSSVSLVPPLVLLSIDHRAAMHPTLVTAASFAINILAEGQEALSRRFANSVDDRFAGVGYHLSPRGHVLLDGALAHVEVERVACHEAGDHTLVIGRVVAGAAHEGRPLCYFRGGYAELG